MALLAAAFALTALLYALAGFGGGSTYTALLVLSEVDYRLLPSIALVCNILVVANGARAFLAAGHIRLRTTLPLCLASAPAAWAGGRLPVSEAVFVPLLGASLLVAGVLMFVDVTPEARQPAAERSYAAPVAVGGGVGFLSGLVGIGGGVFLAPFLHLVRWAGAQEIAGTASVFILINSIAGLAGQLMKLGALGELEAAARFWPLPVAVVVGGAAGSFLGARRLAPAAVKRVTGVLILLVAARLIWRSVA
ncbi:MAG: sulfite exporter TauE/SafE family protein [Pseudomonadota bacterium]